MGGLQDHFSRSYGPDRSPFSSSHRSTWPSCLPWILLVVSIAYLRQCLQPTSLEVIEGLRVCRANVELPLQQSNQYRTESDRFEPGTRDVLIHNATIWTGGDDGREVLHSASVLLSRGLVAAINPRHSPSDAMQVDAMGAWVTPGIVDMHSHAGQLTFPVFAATNSLGSRGGIVIPYSRSIDSFDTHDLALRLVTSGGTTTSMILPGSGSAMGGEAYTMKFRNTSGNSPTSMLVEPPWDVDAGSYRKTGAWRNAKHAVGENVFKTWRELGGTRQDNMYYMRRAYAGAKIKRDAQDAWCATANAQSGFSLSSLGWPFGNGRRAELGPYPHATLEEELLVDVLRGKVKIHVHAYESTDFDALMRLSNEFHFPMTTMQHAHEAWFSMETLKKFHGGAPAIAMFATSSIYKHEAYRHSLFAPIILAENDITVIFKSDHPPAVDSRYLLGEATLAHHFGLDEAIALQSVTSNPAKAIGLDHRVGYLLPGYDADVVIWQSHPLSLGATPRQVFVDGIPQLDAPSLVPRPVADQKTPGRGDYSQQIEAAKMSHHGDVDLTPTWTDTSVTFTNVSSYIYRDGGALQEGIYQEGTVVIDDGIVVCAGVCSTAGLTRTVNLMGGEISPGLTLFGTSLGLIEINEEPSTTDADTSPLTLQPSSGEVPSAANGAVFGGKESRISLRAGITNAITPPMSASIFKGYSMYLSVAAPHRLHRNAIITKEVAYHVSIGHAPVYPATVQGLQISSQIQALRTLLLNDVATTPTQKTFQRIASGDVVLVVFVSSADQMASLIEMKKDVEEKRGSAMRMVFDGALEAHLLAVDIAAADIGVITRERGNPVTWDDRRALPGVPLTNDTNISALRRAGVAVGIGMTGSRASTSNLRYFLGYSLTDTTSVASKIDALSLASSNLEKILGVPAPETWVATEYGGLLDIGRSRVVAVGKGDGTVAGF